MRSAGTTEMVDFRGYVKHGQDHGLKDGYTDDDMAVHRVQ